MAQGSKTCYCIIFCWSVVLEYWSLSNVASQILANQPFWTCTPGRMKRRFDNLWCPLALYSDTQITTLRANNILTHPCTHILLFTVVLHLQVRPRLLGQGVTVLWNQADQSISLLFRLCPLHWSRIITFNSLRHLHSTVNLSMAKMILSRF